MVKKIISRIELQIVWLYNKLVYNFDKVSFGKYSKVLGIKNIKIGKNLSVARFFWLEAVLRHEGIDYNPKIVIGNNVNISELVHIAAINEIIIGSNVLIGSKVLIEDHNHGCYSGLEEHSSPEVAPNFRKLYSSGSIVIEDNVFIGDNVVILGDTIIGCGAVIAANTLILSGSRIPPKTIFAGSPARVIKKFNSLTLRWEKHEN